MKFGIAERYRLEVHWQQAIYNQEGEAELVGCCFGGPVIGEVQEMNQQDAIDIDFGKQYLIFVPKYYVANVSWSGVRHTSQRIYLDNVVVRHSNINAVPKFKDNDFIVIDTTNHEDEKHEHHLTYPSYLINKDGDLYNFGR